MTAEAMERYQAVSSPSAGESVGLDHINLVHLAIFHPKHLPVQSIVHIALLSETGSELYHDEGWI